MKPSSPDQLVNAARTSHSSDTFNMHNTYGDLAVKIEMASPDGSKIPLNGEFFCYGSGRLLLRTPKRLELETVVSVEHGDVMYLGEVLSSQLESELESLYRTCVRVEHKLTSLQSLMLMREQLLGLDKQATHRARMAKELSAA